ncbi:hypothetical protein [Variovorax terrae]|uniref:Uncharacterized protein n=1 Tax=Variovorax terrae TaxID=2923278 RepID=A0A9X1VXG8_9BURK|nr:hypothetical protein [Variovorax terrae]MCJ0765073.1 hypothetical protein [Variovorax terrae]
MGPLDLFFHLSNFVAPALGVAALSVLAARFFGGKQAYVRAWWSQLAIVFVVNAAVLLAGLWFFGRDGKMATYAALVLACGTSQWLLLRGWRR